MWARFDVEAEPDPGDGRELRYGLRDENGRLNINVATKEQLELLRLLWTQRSVTFEGRYHRVTGAGIAPLPVQRPIPLWIGAAAPPGFARAGRMAEAWFPMMAPGSALDEAKAILAATSGSESASGTRMALVGGPGRSSAAWDPRGGASNAAAKRKTPFRATHDRHPLRRGSGRATLTAGGRRRRPSSSSSPEMKRLR